MSVGGRSKFRAELNVTPLIDVLVVLLITLMIILPSLSHGLDALVPQPPDQKASSPRDDVVLTVPRNGMIRLNQEKPVTLAGLDQRLKVLFKNAAHHVIFLRGDKDLDFRQVAEVIDMPGALAWGGLR